MVFSAKDRQQHECPGLLMLHTQPIKEKQQTSDDTTNLKCYFALYYDINSQSLEMTSAWHACLNTDIIGSFLCSQGWRTSQAALKAAAAAGVQTASDETLSSSLLSLESLGGGGGGGGRSQTSDRSDRGSLFKHRLLCEKSLFCVCKCD